MCFARSASDSRTSGRTLPATQGGDRQQHDHRGERVQHRRAVPEEADQRRAGEERAVADRRDDADPRGRAAPGRRRRRSCRPGSRGRCRRPRAAVPANDTSVDGPNENSSRPASAVTARTRMTGTRPQRSSAHGPNQRPAVIAARKAASASVPTASSAPWSVDQRDADPVVAGALGEGEGEHEDADQQRPPLAPGVERRAGARRGRGGAPRPAWRGRRRSAASTSGTTIADGEADHQQVGGDRDVERHHRRAAERAGHGPQAERGVEAGHDRAAEAALDDRALHVHRDVPGAERDAEDEQAAATGTTPTS